ncbi:MAG TPA: hypothetical protein VFN19_07065, partial [Candidatus Nanopelagicales bacterium]|nr:hypothetical protein [Candidatus Nanopelagicales bacterium]
LTVAALLVPAGAPAAAAADVVGGPRLAGPRTVVGSAATPLPDVAAAAWVVADADTGEILAAKAPHTLHRPASTLKTLTAVTLMPELDPAAVHKVTAAEQAQVYGSRAGIVVGARYTVDDLWHGLLLPSGNDAAAALAAEYGGLRKTVKAMNAKARQLRALDTTVRNPSGLDADGQYTSAYDLALLARAALALPEFRTISGTVSYDFPGTMPKKGKKRQTYKIYGQDRLLNDGYRGIIAGKTGYTTLAGRTFWVAARRHGHTVLVTLLGITEASETAAAKLLTWGLRNAADPDPVGELVDPVPPPPPAAPAALAPTGAPAGADSPFGHVAGDATTGDRAAAGTGAGWLPALLVLLLAALGALAWFALRGSRASAARDEQPPAAAPAPTAVPVERAGPASPTGNVMVVRPPGRPD